MRNFSQHGSVFLSAEAQSKRDQTSGTHAPRNPSASKPGCGAGCMPGTGNQRRRLKHSTVPRSGVSLLSEKMGQEETAIIRSLKNLIYASPGCRAFFPAACSVSRLADPSSVPIAGSTRDGELQEDRGAKRRKRQRHQQPWQQQPVVPPESLVEQRGWGNMLWMSFGGNSIPDRHAKLVMDPQDQRLPLGDCPLRAA